MADRQSCSAAIDVQCGHAVVPVAGLLVEEQLDPQRAHNPIVLEFAQLSNAIAVITGDPGHHGMAPGPRHHGRPRFELRPYPCATGPWHDNIYDYAAGAVLAILASR